MKFASGVKNFLILSEIKVDVLEQLINYVEELFFSYFPLFPEFLWYLFLNSSGSSSEVMFLIMVKLDYFWGFSLRVPSREKTSESYF